MLSVAIKTSTKKAQKYLRGVQRKDIPSAQRMATIGGARASVTASKRKLAKGAKVSQKFIAGRVAKGKYNKKREGLYVYLIHTHINPAGTRKYPQALKSAYRITKTGKKGKGHGQLHAMGRKYDRAFTYSNGWKVPMILQRKGSKAYPIERKTIELGAPAVISNRRVLNRTFPPKFKSEFERLLKVKVKRRASR